MTDIIVKVVPQDPDVVEGPEDLLVSRAQEDLKIVLPVNDVVIVPKLQDLAIGVKGPDVSVLVTDIGPQGPPGEPGAAGAQIITSTADQALGGNRVVKPVAGDAVDYASSDVPTDGDQILGITVHAAIAGDDIEVQTGGPMDEPSWSWITGLPIYCGLNGVLTQTPPESGVLCRVAKALSPTRILINVEEAIVLAS